MNDKYNFDGLLVKHAAVIQEKDELVKRLKELKGKKYIVDFRGIKEYFHPVPRGRVIPLDGGNEIYVNGVEKFTVEQVELIGSETLMQKTTLWSLEWVDTESKPDAKGYTMEYREAVDATTYRDVVFRCGGFTLKAPEVMIITGKTSVLMFWQY